MKPVPMLLKRFAAGVIGVLYAVLYGFWAMLATGGGHVNFIWLFLFFIVGFFGLYYPVMAVLLVDLRKRLLKMIFGSLIGFNLIVSVVMIVGWITEKDGDRPSDYSRMVQHNGIEGVLLCGSLHFLPTLVFAFMLIRAITRDGSKGDNDDSLLSLQLP